LSTFNSVVVFVEQAYVWSSIVVRQRRLSLGGSECLGLLGVIAEHILLFISVLVIENPHFTNLKIDQKSRFF